MRGSRSVAKEGHAMIYILLWLLGVPATLLIILILLGVGR